MDFLLDTVKLFFITYSKSFGIKFLPKYFSLVYFGFYTKYILKISLIFIYLVCLFIGVTVSNWEVMERLKSMVAPDQFTQLKVAKSSVELLTFDAEVDSKTTLSKFLIKLDGKTIKLSNFGEPLRVRAARKKIPFPKRHDWNTYFKEAETTNENNPGERPDTVYIGHLPTKWFIETDRDNKPSEVVVAAVFGKFGEVRAVDIPNNDPYRERISQLAEAKENKDSAEKGGDGATIQPQITAVNTAAGGFKVFSHNSNIHFDCYIQYMEYAGFAKCMKQLRAKKLLFMIEEERGATGSIDVDFDKTQHMSDKNIKRRNRRRERLIRTDAEHEAKRKREQEEQERKEEIEQLEARREQLLELKEVQDALQQKEERRALREEKRKQKREEKRTVERQQKEREKKIIELTLAMKTQRRDEAVALVTELLTRIAKRKEEEEIEEARRQAEILLRKQIEEKKRKLDEEKQKEEEMRKKQEMTLDDEEKELKKRLKKIMMEKKQRTKEKKKTKGTKKTKKEKNKDEGGEPPVKKSKRASGGKDGNSRSSKKQQASSGGGGATKSSGGGSTRGGSKRKR